MDTGMMFVAMLCVASLAIWLAERRDDRARSEKLWRDAWARRHAESERGRNDVK